METASVGGASFAEMCFQHTYAGCGCGMCKPGDVCPTPILKFKDEKFDENQLPEQSVGLIDHTLIQNSR